MARPRTVYRGRPQYHNVLNILLLIVLFLFFFVVWFFNYMQTFIVFDGDGLHVEPPFLQEELEVEDTREVITVAPEVDAEIVVDPADFSDVYLLQAEPLENLHARYLARNEVSATTLSGYGGSMNNTMQDSIVMQLKGPDGMFHYRSAISLATDYVVNGTEDLTKPISELKEQGVYLVAEIGTILDETMAERNTPWALRNTEGNVLHEDNVGTWIDPYNPAVRAYLLEIIQELGTLGFDEVVLSGLIAPQTDSVVYSHAMTGTPAVTEGVASLAIYLSEAVHEQGMVCSVLCYANPLRSGESARRGQDLELFSRIFDRFYLHTETYLLLNDLPLLKSGTGVDDGARIVPILSGVIPDTDSWAVQQ